MNLRDEFERCWPWLAQAVLAYGPTHNEHHVWEKIEAGEAHLFPMPNAAMVVELKRWPTGYKEAVAWLAGGSLDEIKTFTPQIEAWAKSIGAKSIGVDMARLGWARKLPGYSAVSVNIMKEL